MLQEKLLGSDKKFEAIELQSINSEIEERIRPVESKFGGFKEIKNFMSKFGAFLYSACMEIGNIPIFFFNIAATTYILTEVITEFNNDEPLHYLDKLSFVLAIIFSVITLINDFFLINPFEIYKKITTKNKIIKIDQVTDDDKKEVREYKKILLIRNNEGYNMGFYDHNQKDYLQIPIQCNENFLTLLNSMKEGFIDNGEIKKQIVGIYKASQKSVPTTPYKYIFYFIIYSSFLVLSLNSAVGGAKISEIFHFSSFTKKIFFAVLSVISAGFGFSYYRSYNEEFIVDTFDFLEDRISKDKWRNTFKSMGQRRALPLSLQTAKNFSIISIYYPLMGAFYMHSLIERLKENFSLNIPPIFLKPLMITLGMLVLISNFFTRFLRSKQKYFVEESKKSYSEKERKKELKKIVESFSVCEEIISEIIIYIAGITFLIRNFGKDLGGPLGLLISFISPVSILYFGVGAWSIRRRNKKINKLITLHSLKKSRCCLCRCSCSFPRPSGTSIISFFCKLLPPAAPTINFFSRLHKSGILLFAAFWKIQDMLKKDFGINLGLDIYDCSLLVAMIGIPIGLNNSANNKRKLENNIEYFRNKLFPNCGFLKKSEPKEQELKIESPENRLLEQPLLSPA